MTELGWRAEVAFDDLVKEMVDADLALARRDSIIRREGYPVYQTHE
jgi:hypothetical protein